MEEIKIKINDVEYILRNSTRALLKFEELTGKSVLLINENYTDTITLFYSMLYGANKNTFKYGLDEFIDVLDDNEGSIEVFNNYLISQAPVENKKKVKKV